MTYGLQDGVRYLDRMFMAAVADVVRSAAQYCPSRVVWEAAVLNAPENMFSTVSTDAAVGPGRKSVLREGGESRARESFEVRVSNQYILLLWIAASNTVALKLVTP